MTLRLQQIAQLEHHRARLVEDRQVEHAGLRASLAGGVEPLQFALDRIRDGFEKAVAHREHQAAARGADKDPCGKPERDGRRIEV